MSLKDAAEYLASKGRGPDTMLVHMAPSEVAGLQQLAMAAGGSLSLHPDTGLPEAGFLSNLLPTIIGVGMTMAGLGPLAAAAGGALAGAATNKQNPLMGAISGGMGGYGGAGLAQGLGAAGATNLATPVAGPTGAPMPAPAAEAMEASLSKAGYGGDMMPPPAPTTTTASKWADMSGADRWDAMKQGGKNFMAEPGATFDKFVGTAADKSKGIEATGMGGTGKALSSAYMAAAPVIAAPVEMKKPEEEEAPGYSFDWNDIYREGGGFTRTYAEGGTTDDKPKMSGASAAAMDYLMGKTSVSPQAMEMQRRAEPPKPEGAKSLFGNVLGRIAPGTNIGFGAGTQPGMEPVDRKSVV